MNRLKLAIEVAKRAHAGQKDKAGQDYIQHPLAVMQTILDQGGSETEAIVAVLHDTVEDTDLTIDYIRELFGNVVADAVDAVSRRSGEVYRDFILRIKKNAVATKVKIADLKHNSSPERIASLPEEMKSIVNRYRKALDVLEN